MVDYAYCANRGGGVVFTLPVSAAIGTQFEIVGKAGLWAINQNNGQTIYFGDINTTTGVAGALTATDKGDCVKLRCITANSDYRVVSSIGNISVT
jgi:hypothetical protein